MSKPAKKTREHKSGSGQQGAAIFKRQFARKYLELYRNGTRAVLAISPPGTSEKGAGAQACRLLKDPVVQGHLDELLLEAERISGITKARTLLELARLSYGDARKFYRADGTVKPPIEWDDDMAATVGSVEVDEFERGGQVRGRTSKIKLLDKNAALDKAMRHLGMFEKDNSQRSESLSIEVELVGGKKGTDK